MPGALSDVKVIDLTQHVAGPYATRLMADMGAEVIKIENPRSGDVARRLGPFPGDVPHSEKSGLFLHLNTNKKSLTLNLKSATGQRILQDLVKDADILVESYPPKVSQALGITYEELEKVNPRLVVSSITNFGQTGPYRDFKATDMVIYALGGVMHVTGVYGREPVKIGNYAILYLCGTASAALTMATFYGARYQGLGQHIDISLMEQAAHSMDRGGTGLTAWAYSGSPYFQRAATFRGSILPTGLVPCADGYVWFNPVVAWWPRVMEAIGRPELAQDPRYTQNMFNLELADEVDAILLEWTMQHTKQEIMLVLGTAAVTAANTMEDVFKDPHLRARGFFTEIDHPVAGKFEYPGEPYKLTETPWQAGRAPLLGEHTQEILGGRLGYTQQDLATLRAAGVI